MNIDKEMIQSFGMYDYKIIKGICGGNAAKIGDIFHKISKEKPILVVFGNCQSLYIAHILNNTDVIHAKYNIVLFPPIQDFTDEKETGLSKDYMQYISFFVYQNSSINNKISPLLATNEHILPLLKADTIKCSFPFVYFKGYYPQYIWNQRNNIETNITPYGDINIQTMIEHGMSIEECEKKLSDVNFYSESILKENFDNTIMELQKREEECDIHISDYIIGRFQEEYLFYTPSHPTTLLLVEVARRILNHVGITQYDIDLSGLPENDGYEMLIYDSVKQKMKLKFHKEKFMFSRLIDSERVPLLEYIRKYKQYNFPELSKNIKDYFRTIDVSHMILINDDVAKMRSPKKFTLCGRELHLCLYLNINKSGIIAKIPGLYAPKFSYICPANIVGIGGVHGQ